MEIPSRLPPGQFLMVDLRGLASESPEKCHPDGRGLYGGGPNILAPFTIPKVKDNRKNNTVSRGDSEPGLHSRAFRTDRFAQTA
jgi:hypothetical protein